MVHSCGGRHFAVLFQNAGHVGVGVADVARQVEDVQILFADHARIHKVFPVNQIVPVIFSEQDDGNLFVQFVGLNQGQRNGQSVALPSLFQVQGHPE